MNLVLQCEDKLRDRNYILQPDPSTGYWANITLTRLNRFVARCGDQFNIVLVGEQTEVGDFYAIPYHVLKPVLVSGFQFTAKTKQVRWIVSIRSHQLKVRKCPYRVDVGAFYGNSAVLLHPGQPHPETVAEANEYAIANRKVEIEQRQKQSVFRRRVLQNFEGRCCLSGITEEALVVASHIVPWAKRIDTRLDPANGLLLYCPYDRLFDQGFISLDDSLRVVVSPVSARCSSPLRVLLEQLAGQQAREPVRWAIKAEYLAFHRAKVLRTDTPVPEEDKSEPAGLV